MVPIETRRLLMPRRPANLTASAIDSTGLESENAALFTIFKSSAVRETSL